MMVSASCMRVSFSSLFFFFLDKVVYDTQYLVSDVPVPSVSFGSHLDNVMYNTWSRMFRQCPSASFHSHEEGSERPQVETASRIQVSVVAGQNSYIYRGRVRPSGSYDSGYHVSLHSLPSTPQRWISRLPSPLSLVAAQRVSRSSQRRSVHNPGL